MRKLVLLLSAVMLFTACEKPTETTASKDTEAFSMVKKAGEESADAVEAVEAAIPEWAKGVDIASVDVKDEVERVKKAYADARESFMERYKKASKKDKLAMRKDAPSPMPFAEHIKAVIEAQPNSPGISAAYAYVAGQMGDEGEAALDVLFEKYSDCEEMKDLFVPLVYGTPSAKTEERLKMLMESSDKNVAGMATYGMASFLKSLGDMKKRFVQYPDSAPSPEAVEYVNSRDVESGEIVALYRKVVEEYPDVKVMDRAIGKICGGELFALENLAVGKVAPDIEGEDMDGVSFKLSDYRGKVVMLDFWGDW